VGQGFTEDYEPLVMSRQDTGPSKYIAFFRLVEACDRPGCPVCQCLLADARQYLDALLYEQVNDPGTRRRLHASWGFCNWHAWMLREGSDPAFGTAIMYEDFLRAAIERFEGTGHHVADGPRALLGWLGRLGRRRPRSPLAGLYRGRAPCPGCTRIAESETNYVRIALQYIDDPEFDSAYRRSGGFCVRHVLHALEVDASAAKTQRLVSRTCPKWLELRRDLQGFIEKHDHKKRQPFTEAESTAYLRALEVLSGAPGLFGSDLRDGTRVGRDVSDSRPDEIAELRAEVERLRAELEAARSAASR
jgi:uncharacterized protein DUF6062